MQIASIVGEGPGGQRGPPGAAALGAGSASPPCTAASVRPLGMRSVRKKAVFEVHALVLHPGNTDGRSPDPSPRGGPTHVLPTLQCPVGAEPAWAEAVSQLIFSRSPFSASTGAGPTSPSSETTAKAWGPPSTRCPVPLAHGDSDLARTIATPAPRGLCILWGFSEAASRHVVENPKLLPR